jgi:oligosaccharide reducing-end xylanase
MMLALHRGGRPALLAVALALVTSCHSTLDSIGCNERRALPDGGGARDGGSALQALLAPLSYPNPFRDWLGKSNSEISAKLSDTFNQLFHGDPAREAIFVPVGTDQAYIRDVFHDEVRTEGIGLGMLITVELDKRDDFDRLWRYAKSIQVKEGPRQGYFPSYCTASTEDEVACDDPYGLQQITTALLLARGRWRSSPATIDYGAEAAELLDIIRNKDSYNCGIAGGITGTFDPQSKLAYSIPTTDSLDVSSPAVALPAYYELWTQATGDPFWSQAAAAARTYWKASSNSTTGLMPARARFDGTPVPGYDDFRGESYRTLFNIALDCIWSGRQQWSVDESDRLLQFFYGQGISSYGQIYSLEGIDKMPARDQSLVAANGAAALIATVKYRTEFVSEVWNLPTPTGGGRYYSGILQMLALLMLSGQLQVF